MENPFERNDSDGCIAVSPNYNQIATLDIETEQLGLYQLDKVTTLKVKNYDIFKHIKSSFFKTDLSISVSNEFTLPDGTVEVLITISCFGDDDMKPEKPSRRSSSCHSNVLSSVEEANVGAYDETNKRSKAFTCVISAARQSRIATPIDNMGGIVKFLDGDEDEDRTELVLINAFGIKKCVIKHGTIGKVIKDGWFDFLFPGKTIEEYWFPTRFSLEMTRLPENETCALLIRRSLVKGRFVIENYKDKVQTIEMYNLKTKALENIFQKREESAASVVGRGSPYFAISNNETLFAYCRGTNSITVYLMENALEVNTKKFKEKSVIRILSFEFLQGDNQLLILVEEEKKDTSTWENDVMIVTVVWDLFSNSDNCIRRFDDTLSLFPTERIHQEMFTNFHEDLIPIFKHGTIISILEKSKMVEFLNPENEGQKGVIPLDEYHDFNDVIPLDKYHDLDDVEDASSTMNHHFIYDHLGNRLDYETESHNIIIDDPEPWLHNKRYKRLTVYLDDHKDNKVDKSIQLFIGETTVQVWRKRKDLVNGSSKRTLEYIWTIKNKHGRMQIQSLKVGFKEFSLTLHVPSGISQKHGNEIQLEWPDKVNGPVDACRALEFLDKEKNEPSGPKKQHKFENLVQQTENIVRKCLIRKHGLWKMLDIRFDIMANLIRGNRVSLIRYILSLESDDGKNKHLHIPRLYSWDGQPKETDLEVAIRRTEGGYRKDTIIVKYLLDYYSDNAVENSNWMFTVSKEIPLLYVYKLEFYVRELFQKPCFGSNEVYLERTQISNSDIIASESKNVHALNFKPGLIEKSESRRLQIFSKKKRSQRSRKQEIRSVDQVYMVPLPDFTVYSKEIYDNRNCWNNSFRFFNLYISPRGHMIDEELLSPFMRTIREDDRTAIYDNPSMAAVIDYKWKEAGHYFLRHVMSYLIFALMYALITDSIKGLVGRISETVLIFIFAIVFYSLGLYLLNIERIQLKNEGWDRYFSVYNFCDLFAALLPMSVASIQFIHGMQAAGNELDGGFVFLDDQMFTILNSFTILMIWIEIFLLLRYFERTGAFIFIIINILRTITSFLVFILLVVFGFGHVMFVLLHDTDKMNVIPNGTSFKIYDNNGALVPQYSELVINQEIDVNSVSDNYFTNFLRSIEAVYFWTNGRWDQLDQWDFWPVDVFSIISSILLVTILQNMLIAIMTGAYDDAAEVSRHAVLKYRAELIADYETFSKSFASKVKKDPRYIFFIGKSDYIKKWLEKSEKAREMDKNFLSEIDGGNPWYYDKDDDDDDDFMNHFRSSSNHSRNRGSYSTIYSLTNLPNRIVPLSFYWFVDDDEKVNSSEPSNTKRKLKEEVKLLKDKIQSMEQGFAGRLNSIESSIKQLSLLLQNK